MSEPKDGQRAESLRQAAGLKLSRAAGRIDAVVRDLNTDGTACEACGAMRRAVWSEYQSAVALRHLPHKLLDHAMKLELGSEDERP